MMGMTSHNQTERTYLGRPEQITVAGRLRAALRHSLMDRTQFVHMVTLVGTRSGIQEREHTRYQKRALMVRYGVWPGEDGACLSVHTLTVAEEQTLASRVVLVKDTALPHKAFVHQRTVAYLNARSYDEIHTFDTAPKTDRRMLVGVDRTVFQPAHSHQFGEIAYLHILDRTAVQDPHMVAYIAHLGSLALCIFINQPFHLMNHLRAVAVERQYIRQAGA